MFTFFVLVTIYNRSYEYPYQYKGQGVRFVCSMRSVWLLRGIQRYGAYKGKVSYGRQMASRGPKGLKVHVYGGAWWPCCAQLSSATCHRVQRVRDPQKWLFYAG